MGVADHANKIFFFQSIHNMEAFKLMNKIQPEVRQINTNFQKHDIVIKE